MTKNESQKSASPSQLIDARIKELDDWRDKDKRSALKTLVAPPWP